MYDVFLISQPSPQHMEEQKPKKSLREHPRSWQSSKLLYTMDCTILYMPHKINHSLYHALGNKTRISPTTTSWLVLLAKTFSCLHKPFIHIFLCFPTPIAITASLQPVPPFSSRVPIDLPLQVMVIIIFACNSESKYLRTLFWFLT